MDDVWLGGSDWTVEGVWVWEPEGVLFQYSNFADHQPNNWNGENCLRKEHSSHQYRWNDKDCDHPSSYICETT